MKITTEDIFMHKSRSSAPNSTDISIAVIFVGVQGAGKTEFYSRYFSGAYTRIALSEIGTRQAERAIIRDCISQGVSYVLDSQNLTREDRRRYFSRAHEAGYRIIGYYFPSTLEESLARARLTYDKNAQRRQKKAFDRLEPPEYNEGYDELYTVTAGYGGEFTAERMKREQL